MPKLTKLFWLLTVISTLLIWYSAFAHKAPEILTQLSPQTLTADDAYTQASRIRRWAKSQVALITPEWTKGRYAKAYHRQPVMTQQKQLPVRPLLFSYSGLISASCYDC